MPQKVSAERVKVLHELRSAGICRVAVFLLHLKHAFLFFLAKNENRYFVVVLCSIKRIKTLFTEEYMANFNRPCLVIKS